MYMYQFKWTLTPEATVTDQYKSFKILQLLLLSRELGVGKQYSFSKFQIIRANYLNACIFSTQLNWLKIS